MPNTRKKVIKTAYKDEESEGETGDFSDSGSEAQISEPPTSDEEEVEEHRSSADEFSDKPNKTRQKPPIKRKPKFAKEFINKIHKQTYPETEHNEVILSQFSVKDLTDADKLLPSVLNLSESDSSDDETPKASIKKAAQIPYTIPEENGSENEDKEEYTDIWSHSIPDSEEIAKKAFMELERHKTTLEETKASLQSYVPRCSTEQTAESNVTDLLALGEEAVPQKIPAKTKRKGRKTKNDSDSELEDWEEVNESKAIPQQGLQLVVALPDYVCKTKKVDVEMMMKRKMNRVKKEHQVFMHKVHVLCWIGHGNYVSPILNDQEIMATVLSMVPKGCYPKSRLDMKYVETITKWYKDKIIIKPDKYENKFRPKAPPLRTILLDQIKSRSVTAKKNMVLIFVAMLRALGLQCRIMFNFVTVPLRPPNSELCSLSTKPKDENNTGDKKVEKPNPAKRKSTESKPKSKVKLPQVDGNYDSCSSSSDFMFDTTLDIEDYYEGDSECEHTLELNKNHDTNSNKFENLLDENDDTDSDDLEKLLYVDKKFNENDSDFENIMQVDGNDDAPVTKTRPMRTRAKRNEEAKSDNDKKDEGVSPPKKSKKNPENPASHKKAEPTNVSLRKSTNKGKGDNAVSNIQSDVTPITAKSPKTLSLKKPANDNKPDIIEKDKVSDLKASPRKTRNTSKTISQATTSNKNDTKNLSKSQVKINNNKANTSESQTKKQSNTPKIVVTNENQIELNQSEYFKSVKEETKRPTRKRSLTTIVGNGRQNSELKPKDTKPKTRAKSAPGSAIEKSKYFDEPEIKTKKPKLSVQQLRKQEKVEDAQRISHKDLTKPKPRAKPKNDVAGDLVNILKGRIKGAKEDAKKGIVKGKVKEESDDDSDYLPVEDPRRRISSDEEFKPAKISPRGPKLGPGIQPSTSKKRLDRRVLSSDDETPKNRNDVWCEIFVEELEQWIAVDVINGKVHCTGHLYKHATHPVCYVMGWDNNNYLKDLTRRYVPHWNTVTRKQRVEPAWWRTAVETWRGPHNAKDKEEDEALDRMQLEAPLPTSIGEYKNHPLYALKRHLLKFEALYPPDAQTLGFVRNEPVYARECVYVCRSRDIWLKEAKVVKMGEKPYKIVKARPKWDRLSNKLITDKPLEVFGPWQVQDYEPPTAENGIVPRNAYGNVELFKECMLPKGTVHIKLPGLNKVCRKLNIDCAPAMNGFDYTGGWAHPAYDGFVVCKEYAEFVTEAWVKDQEEQELKEMEKRELRVFGNWKRLIKGLLIRERLKYKYGFETPSTSQPVKKKGPRFVAKKK